MRSVIPFTKVEATGNDFILLNDRDIELNLLNSTVIKNGVIATLALVPMA